MIGKQAAFAILVVCSACSKSPEKDSKPSTTSVPEVAAQEEQDDMAKPVTYSMSAEQQAAVFKSPVQTLMGEETTLASYLGKPLLIVNVASECGLTPQYEELQSLQKRYGDQGFSVVAFPSNQFGGQEPGTPEEILAFGKENYGVTFPLMQKVDTNGEQQHPIYQALTEIKDAEGQAGNVQWNFEKFFISADGKSITRIRPQQLATDPAVVALIEADLPSRN